MHGLPQRVTCKKSHENEIETKKQKKKEIKETNRSYKYIAAAELGDYDAHRHKTGYISEFRFLAHQSSDLETKIAELHKTMRSVNNNKKEEEEKEEEEEKSDFFCFYNSKEFTLCFMFLRQGPGTSSGRNEVSRSS